MKHATQPTQAIQATDATHAIQATHSPARLPPGRGGPVILHDTALKFSLA